MKKRQEWEIPPNHTKKRRNSKIVRTPNDIEKHIREYCERLTRQTTRELEAGIDRKIQQRSEEEGQKIGSKEVSAKIKTLLNALEQTDIKIAKLDVELGGLVKKRENSYEKPRILKNEVITEKNVVAVHKEKEPEARPAMRKGTDDEIEFTFSKIRGIPEAREAWIYSLGKISEWRQATQEEPPKRRTWKDERERTMKRRKDREVIIFGKEISDDDETVSVTQAMINSTNSLKPDFQLK